MKYIVSTSKKEIVVVFICIIISALAMVSLSFSLKFMLDDYITPLIGHADNVAGLEAFYRALMVLGTIFLCGVVATFIYMRMMVRIGQGVLKRLRDEMFDHMQKLSIRYFDQHTNGSIMSPLRGRQS